MKTGSIILKDYDKLQLVKRVQELEKRGYVCATRIKSFRKTSKQFDLIWDSYSGKKLKFVGAKELELFMVKMVREDRPSAC
ncbi:hypothetical protein WQ54_31170 [Bacillus sp. SA1-12]|uniref:hypothetical protein n=1 Tax=Bacillus sp. SA1-12 TaxID=1455638 RepID=UPI0006270FB4|nr:hypothetical protein [Bacillus sp. SA1-12]KKI88644.1 hypothetical protein WQ54_31170 [Bacillus sp. SA1-12]